MRADLFIGAQALVYEQAVQELAAGKKQGHWMWCIFPQVVGLGTSYQSQLFGLTITDAAEYVRHPVLGVRLGAVTELALEGPDPRVVFPRVDVLKLSSSMTLFAQAQGAYSVFAEVLRRHFDGARCEETMRRVG